MQQLWIYKVKFKKRAQYSKTFSVVMCETPPPPLPPIERKCVICALPFRFNCRNERKYWHNAQLDIFVVKWNGCAHPEWSDHFWPVNEKFQLGISIIFKSSNKASTEWWIAIKWKVCYRCAIKIITVKCHFPYFQYSRLKPPENVRIYLCALSHAICTNTMQS